MGQDEIIKIISVSKQVMEIFDRNNASEMDRIYVIGNLLINLFANCKEAGVSNEFLETLHSLLQVFIEKIDVVLEGDISKDPDITSINQIKGL